MSSAVITFDPILSRFRVCRGIGSESDDIRILMFSRGVLRLNGYIPRALNAAAQFSTVKISRHAIVNAIITFVYFAP
jgi:hypothetical protein